MLGPAVRTRPEAADRIVVPGDRSRHTGPMSADRLMLLDTAALYFRAFHGLPATITAPDGTPVNAVRGLLDMIGRLVGEFRPSALVACWDDDWRPQWRGGLVARYKAHPVAPGVLGGSGGGGGPHPPTLPGALLVQGVTAPRTPNRR